MAFAVIVAGLALGLPRLLDGNESAGSPNGGAALAKTDIGKPATAFTLKDQNGQIYTFNPGDGKPHVLVFYMGYF